MIFTKESIHAIIPALISDEALIEGIIKLNAAYRAGDPWVTDAEYDHQWLAELEARYPGHPLLTHVEPEPEHLFSDDLVRHKERMLSTDKAYDIDKLRRYCSTCQKASDKLGLGPVLFMVQPKLDGLAGYDYGNILASRGTDGYEGQNITKAFARGLQRIGKPAQGPGEIVLVQSYFKSTIEPMGFDSPRNFMVGFCGADEASDHHRMVAEAGLAHFVPYTELPTVSVHADDLISNIDALFAQATEPCPYLTDGIVISAVHQDLRRAMGATDHHHRWQISFKKNKDAVKTVCTAVRAQTGRTGVITPVVLIEPTKLPGAIVRKASGHNMAKLMEDGIGEGAVIRIVRSGEVIPTIVGVEEPSPTPFHIHHCPSCGTELVQDGRSMMCPADTDCPAQVAGSIQHFFKTIGTAKGFGKEICKILGKTGKSIPEILGMDTADFVTTGISPGIAENLAESVQIALTTPIDEWRLLTAFGISEVGPASAQKILTGTGLNLRELVDKVSAEQIAAISGFGDITAPLIEDGIRTLRDTIIAVLDMGFPLRHPTAAKAEGQMSGLHVVFTGTFSRPREDLEQMAREAGATVQSSVSKATNRLYVGDKPGASKVNKAASLGITMLTESELNF
ncbi:MULTISPECIES: BRCT domain-containing protein [Acidithiobacillus]|uniref:BRCT domain-containing protein n=2 Tax=Acidithiobacillus TaxID=119977 RepID=A0A179BNJ5_ACIFR|nr:MULTISPECIES: BRCT domain-containing protein [Acidithiobacillus]MEB8476690.1 NAD-dependent DNA ligase [Acidithiobacillus ferriphilus]MEB8485985.1 NAD-dependent DNA ligase [Acidithiobacillus ferriphilus]MEB8489610.1 NAD-dependent DNA ligase [Acidithiobacillus ferriphilus]MEB8492495.1 NAD-dependent DNA ligase [Acidithiobacillus ferriphilus]MEB8515434.1 NAD-dependent DNA ligase [Acidithiobacillus ferriphilus]